MSQNLFVLKSRRVFWGLLCAFLLAGCGNEFRPVAIPIIPPGGTPQAVRHAVVVSDSPPSSSTSAGRSTNIDVSGDTIFTVRTTGMTPVHAALVANQARTVVANRDDDTLSTYLTFANLTIGATTTISLPAGSQPVFVHTREVNTAYVALQGAGVCGGQGGVGVISVTSLLLSSVLCDGAQPVALAELPNGAKLYVANQGSGNVTVFNTVDGSIAARVAVGSSPSWIDVSSDGAFVYVANKNSNTISVIDTATDVLRQNVAAGSGPNFLKFDASRKRVYVTNPGSNSITVIDADPASATFLGKVDVAVGSSPVSVTALANNTKVYVANSGSNSVTVIDAASNTVLSTINVGATPVSIDSTIDSTKVLIANQGSGDVSMIRTSDDTVVQTVPVGPAPRFLLITQ